MYNIEYKIVNKNAHPTAIGSWVDNQNVTTLELVKENKAFVELRRSFHCKDFQSFFAFIEPWVDSISGNKDWYMSDCSFIIQPLPDKVYKLYLNYIDDTEFILRLESEYADNEHHVAMPAPMFPEDMNCQHAYALNESQRMLYTLFSNLPGMAYRCKNDKDWTMEMVSDGCYQLTGYKPSDLINNATIAFNDIIKPEFQNHLWVKWQKVLAKHEYFEEEYAIVLPDGSEKWVFERGCGVYDSNNVLCALEGYITDIDKLKKASLHVAQSNEYFMTVFNSINDAVFIHDYPSGVIHDVNQRACELFGYPREQMLKMEVGQLSALDNAYEQSNALEVIHKAVSIGPQVLEWHARNSAGKEFWVEVNACYANFGQSPKVVITVRDIQERKQAQEVLRQSEEDLKELNAIKDKFFSVIAHDLKSPFNAILGFSELLANDYDSYSEADRKRQIHNISDAASIAYKLLQNLLDWARLQIGRFEKKLVHVELSGLVNETIGICRPIAVEKNITVISEIKYGIVVMADPQMLSSVLRNLLMNAIKFSFKGGEIRILAKPHHLQGQLEISFIDAGVGIHPDDVSKLFKLEYKVQQQGTARELGTGLGLIISSDFVKAMGGTIGVESQLGVGSRFWFSLQEP
jgi:PAS domain S-box-containing protein